MNVSTYPTKFYCETSVALNSPFASAIVVVPLGSFLCYFLPFHMTQAPNAVSFFKRPIQNTYFFRCDKQIVVHYSSELTCHHLNLTKTYLQHRKKRMNRKLL